MAKKGPSCLVVILAALFFAPVLFCCVGPAVFAPKLPVGQQPAVDQAGGQAKKSSRPIIPGIQPVDIYLNLEKRGFTRRGPTAVEGEYLTECHLDQDGVTFTAVVSGTTPSNVYTVKGTVLQTAFGPEKTNEIASEFLGYMASLPYDGADAIGNRRWVEQSMNGGRRDAGPVTFEVFGDSPGARILQITAK